MKKLLLYIRRIVNLSAREVGLMIHNPIYICCMVVFPLVIIFFFTSLMSTGQPEKLPCGVSTTITLLLHVLCNSSVGWFQSTRVAGHYNNVSEARKAIQRNEIYGFLYIPEGTTAKLVSQRQPEVSFYYSNVTLVAGGMIFKDLKTVTTLSSAAVGAAKLQMLGKTPDEIKTIIQPIGLDIHMVGNPWMNYNVYLSSIMIPGILVLSCFLLPPILSVTELKVW